MDDASANVDRLRQAFNRERLLDRLTRLIAVPSPTGQAGSVADCLAEILTQDSFSVERVAAGHPVAPAVVVRLEAVGGSSGRTLQFDGHLDTVHLPFVPPAVDGDRLTGSGAADMKSGIAAAVEAMCILRDTDSLRSGSLLFTAHDLHEAPWGFGQQLDAMIAQGYVGNAVLIPEPLSDRLPVIGRGCAVWKAGIHRPSPPIHEVMRPMDEGSVILAGSKTALRLDQLNQALSARTDPLAGSDSVFIGQFHSGEIYNQFPQDCRLEGTRRWLPGTERAAVEKEFRRLMADVAEETGTAIQMDFQFIRDAFWLDQSTDVVRAFQRAHATLQGQELPLGPKPFVDDGNSFWGLARVPAITHGPLAGGQHTLHEWVSLADLERVATLYALTATIYCNAKGSAPEDLQGHPPS
ncbi:MAG TPA: M20/M25/M40 family metallo-hydrolase [Gemmataceae bacterium]|nr:M20/M25/M40 family metallo-hydrolase [Gemmataceae bacterium]